MRSLLIVAAALSLVACTQPSGNNDPLAGLASWQELDGFVDMYWDESGGRLILKIDEFDSPMIYQSGLARGIGSNDIGLDRGQLGGTNIVEFQRSGPRVLLMQQNLSYRADSDNTDEQRAVAESFARSVLWGFDLLAERDGAAYIDITDFVIRDAHGVAGRLRDMQEGEYAVDAGRSAVFMPRTNAFPDNTEAEAIVTFAGTPTGKILQTVVPDPASITVHIHHSFIRLPDDNYTPLTHDGRSGIIGYSYSSNGFADYAGEIGGSLTRNYGRRHRLEKKDPTAAMSEAVEPIIYYVDRGVPEPVRSALMDGASWWNQAFEAAGYKDAFQVEIMPEGADPLDVRYNVIQWVHRSTRGWSYGYPIMDPRTGEIIKGHVSLGSLRVRQDYLIAEGLLAPYDDETVSDEMMEMSLARIRQLSAHEVGHTIGIEHNFAASTQDRASVMDYPVPLIAFDDAGGIDLSNAYDDKIGAWDKRVVTYAYQDFPDGVDAVAGRAAILEETIRNYRFVADEDSRSVGSAHPYGNLWDNGADAVVELTHLLRVRDYALSNFSKKNIRIGQPLATLEEALVPMYLLHRFQIQAVSKLIGGDYFNYAMRGDGQDIQRTVSADEQRVAISALLGLLDAEQLQLPQHIVDLIPPRPIGFAKTRETFPNSTGTTFDSIGPATSAVALTLDALINPQRAARLIEQNANDAGLPGFSDVCASILDVTWFDSRDSGTAGLIQRRTDTLVLHALMRLSVDKTASPEVRGIAAATIVAIDNWLSVRTVREGDANWRALYIDSRSQIAYFREDPAMVAELPQVVVPPGSPIGSDSLH